MIRTTYLTGGKINSSDVIDIKNVKGEIWIDCLNPGKTELQLLSDETGIPRDDFQRALDLNERPSISDFENFSRITFHAPYLDKNHNYFTIPLSIFITGRIIIFLRTKHIEAIDKLQNFGDAQKIDTLRMDVTYTLYILLSEVIDHFFRISNELEEEIERIEENVFKKQRQKAVEDIFKLKKTLIYFHRSLTGNREVITGIEKQFLKEIRGKNLKKFRYLYNDVIQLIDMTSTQREIITGSLEIHLTAVSNNLNDVMKRLTIITSFVLLPTLISGIYGMNFQFMPEIHVFGMYGYFFAIGLMIISVIAVYLYFKRKEWI